MIDWNGLSVCDLTPDHVAAIATWRYRDRWALYDSDGELDPAMGYHAVIDPEGELVGFCCLGVDARVPGLDEDPDVVDVGVGLDPRYVHEGHGGAFASAVLDWARGEARGAVRFRAVVQDWNEPSLRLARALGFVDSGRHDVVRNGETVRYVLMVTP